MQDVINTSAVQIAVQRSAMKRVQRIAVSEYREIEGQLHAMCDLWERTYGVKQDQIKQEIAEPPKLKVVNSQTKVRRKTKKVNGNRGKVRTPEQRARLSAAMKGRVISAETRRKMSEAHKGKKMNPQAIIKGIHTRKINAAKKKLAQLQAMIAEQEKNPEVHSGQLSFS